MNPFGIEHEPLSKAFKAISPKIARTLSMDTKVRSHGTLDEKLRRHSINARRGSAAVGNLKSEGAGLRTPQRLAEQRKLKQGAHGIYAAISRNNRENRVLP